MYKDHRLLKVYYSDPKKIARFREIIQRPEIKAGLKDRNLKVSTKKLKKTEQHPPFWIELYGYDGLLKYRSKRLAIAEIKLIFGLIDQMPMRQQEMRKF